MNKQNSNVPSTTGFIENIEQEREEKLDKNKRKERNNPSTGWITRFLKRPGNEWLEEVDRDFLTDFTNLLGLDEEISYMSQGLHVILSEGQYLDSNGNSNARSKTEGKYLDAAEMLYGLVHVRFLLTDKGLANVFLKYKEGIYGVCPRHYCEKTAVLPIGMFDKVGQDKVKVYCPSCEDVYHSSLPGNRTPDGAYFGTSLPQMFFMAYPALHPNPTIGHYTPRLHGFRIHGSVYHSECGPKEAEMLNTNNQAFSTKHSRSKAKGKDKSKDVTKKNGAARKNKSSRLPPINGHASPETQKKSRQRRRHKRNEDIDVQERIHHKLTADNGF